MTDPNATNLDPAEIAKFEALAERWWDPESEFRPLHDINPLRLNYIDQRAGLDGKQVLDVGCGGGILAESMARRGAQVTAIDMAEAPLAVGQIHARQSGIDVNYFKSMAEDHAAQSPASYDVVTCLEMLEHVPDPSSTVAACAALARPGGELFFSTINRNPKSFLFAIVGAEYVLRLLPRGTHEYAKFIRPSELAESIRKAGLVVNEVTGMTYNPITKRYKLGNDASVNYLIHASKPA